MNSPVHFQTKHQFSVSQRNSRDTGEHISLICVRLPSAAYNNVSELMTDTKWAQMVVSFFLNVIGNTSKIKHVCLCVALLTAWHDNVEVNRVGKLRLQLTLLYNHTLNWLNRDIFIASFQNIMAWLPRSLFRLSTRSKFVLASSLSRYKVTQIHRSCNWCLRVMCQLLPC